MAQFPANIVTTTNIPDTNPLTTLAANNHSTKHNDMRDEIVAIETYLGKTGSTVAGSVQNILLEITGTDQAVGKTATQSITNKTLGTGTKVALGSDATGDTYYNSGSGTVARRGIGSDGQVMTVVAGVPNWQSPTAGNFNYAVDSGAANAYVVTLTPALGAYTAGTLVQFKATNANTTASTVNVNGLGAKSIKKLGGSTDLVSGDIAAGMIVELEYDGTNFLMLNPVANAPLTAGNIGTTFTAGESITAGQAVSLYPYSSDGGILIDTKTTGNTSIGSGGGSQTISFTVANNTNRALVVFVNLGASGGTVTSPTATYAGVSMTLVNTVTVSSSQTLTAFTLSNPTVGTNNLVITLGASGVATTYVSTSVRSYYNTTGLATFASASSNTTSYTTPPLGMVLVSGCGGNTGVASVNNNSNYHTSGINGFAVVSSGDSGLSYTTSNATVTYTGGPTSIIVVGLTAVTTPSAGVVKSSASTVANDVNVNKYTTFAGFAQSTVTVGQTLSVTTDASVTGLSGLTPLSTYYLSDTAGAISTTAGTNSKKVGIAISATSILMKDSI